MRREAAGAGADEGGCGGGGGEGGGEENAAKPSSTGSPKCTAEVGSAALTTAAPAAGSPAAASPAADLPATDWVSGKKQFVVPVPGPNAPPNSLEGKTFVLTGSFPEVVGDAGLGAFLQFLNPPSPAPAHLHLNPSLLHAQSLARRESRR